MGDNGSRSVAVPPGARRLTLRFECREALIDQYAQNLAKGGAFVATGETFGLREVVEVQLDLAFARRLLSLAAEVVHCVPAGQAPPGIEAGVAVQFLDPATTLRDQLAAFLQPAGEESQTIDADPPTSEFEGTPVAPRPEDDADLGLETFGLAEDLTARGADLVGEPIEGFETTSLVEPEDRTFTQRASREAARVPVEVRGPTGQSLRGRTRNVSESGVLVSVDGEELPVGREVQLNLIHPRTGEQLGLTGRVTRHVAGEGVVAAVAIQIDPTEGDRTEVNEFLEEVRSVERKYRDQGIRGALQELGAVSLLQMFPALAPRGTITVMSGVEEGTVAFEGAQLLVAEVGSVQGVKALARILSWREGFFEFRGQLDPIAASRPRCSLERAIEEALGLLESEDSTVGPSLSADQRFEVSHSCLDALSMPLSKSEEAVVELAAAGFTLRRILDVIPEKDAQVRAAVLSLCERGVLEPIY